MHKEVRGLFSFGEFKKERAGHILCHARDCCSSPVHTIAAVASMSSEMKIILYIVWNVVLTITASFSARSQSIVAAL